MSTVHRPTAHPAPRPTVIRLADLRDGQRRRITSAISFYVASREPHVAAYAAVLLTKTAGAPLISFTSARLVGLYAIHAITDQLPTTADDYRQLFAAVARQHSTATYPAFAE
jgi:hypothetical protein